MVISDGDWSEVKSGYRFRIHTPSASTNGTYSVIEFEIEPGQTAQFHTHANEQKQIFILDGVGRFARGNEIIDVAAGSTLIVPRGVQNAWTNPWTSTLRMLITFTPGRIEELFREIQSKSSCEESKPTMDQLGTSIIDPPSREVVSSLLSWQPSRMN